MRNKSLLKYHFRREGGREGGREDVRGKMEGRGGRGERRGMSSLTVFQGECYLCRVLNCELYLGPVPSVHLPVINPTAQTT